MYGIFSVMTFQSVKNSPTRTALPPQAAAVGALQNKRKQNDSNKLATNNFQFILLTVDLVCSYLQGRKFGGFSGFDKNPPN